jgi:hypothetical protein
MIDYCLILIIKIISIVIVNSFISALFEIILVNPSRISYFYYNILKVLLSKYGFIVE